MRRCNEENFCTHRNYSPLFYYWVMQIRFFYAPEPFCRSRWGGITLPPVGIFICPRSKSKERFMKQKNFVALFDMDGYET